MLTFLIFWPFIAALALLFTKTKQARELALTAAIVELAASLVAVSQFDKMTEVPFAVYQPWITSLGINYSLGMDGISLLLVLLTTVLVPLIILSSFGHGEKRPSNFYGLILLMQMALSPLISG